MNPHHNLFTLDDVLAPSNDSGGGSSVKSNTDETSTTSVATDGNNNTNNEDASSPITEQQLITVCANESNESCVSPSSSAKSGFGGVGGGGNNGSNQNKYKQSLEYLKELFSDRERLHLLPFGSFTHLARLLEQEIQRVRTSLIHIDGSADQRPQLVLPEPEGEVVQKSTKIYVPVDKYPEYNFVGRIIGPRGLTIRELEVDCGCKLYIRGKGSLRDKNKEEKLRGQGNMDHLNDELHVLITVEDTENRAKLKLERAVSQINKLFESVISNQDEFKFRQLAELAILNDKFNPNMKQPTLASTLKDSHLQMLKNSTAAAAAAAASLSPLTASTIGSPYPTNAMHTFGSLFAQTFPPPPPPSGYESLFTPTAAQLTQSAAACTAGSLLTGNEVPLVPFPPYSLLSTVSTNRFHPYKKK